MGVRHQSPTKLPQTAPAGSRARHGASYRGAQRNLAKHEGWDWRQLPSGLDKNNCRKIHLPFIGY